MTRTDVCMARATSLAADRKRDSDSYDALSRLSDVEVDIPDVDGVAWSYNDNNELLIFAGTEYTYDGAATPPN